MAKPQQTPLFGRLAVIGIGLIGSSIARAAREHNLAGSIAVADASEAHRRQAAELGLADAVHADAADAVRDADLVMLCVPLGAYAAVAAHIGPALKPGAIVSDVGSCKQSVIRDVAPHLPAGVAFVPGHPVAGTEHSGPAAGFAALFGGRWCILTPTPDTDPAATEKLRAFWAACGSRVEMMEPRHHDLVLAITSHVPHLIAYNIVGTADDMETVTQSEVIKYSAGGFRDFTRIAASDPTMWRDVFLNNREAVLEMLGRFTEDLIALQRAIRWGEGDALFDLFTRTRAIRRAIIDAGQETAAPDFGRGAASPTAGSAAPAAAKPAKPKAG
ncbi:prephenate/arogenate dehydrogenase family protein [Ferrovibrio sp.]|uniref:prephenate/arogenate dehydrogenase family protein n=1 Tax=Ferrovibrio sp. TaxID=1917215 RepID=UPI0031202B25